MSLRESEEKRNSRGLQFASGLLWRGLLATWFDESHFGRSKELPKRCELTEMAWTVSPKCNFLACTRARSFARRIVLAVALRHVLNLNKPFGR
jgi:hypothetical protein